MVAVEVETLRLPPSLVSVSVDGAGRASMEVTEVVAAVQLQTLRLPPSVLSVSVNTDRWKKQY